MVVSAEFSHEIKIIANNNIHDLFISISIASAFFHPFSLQPPSPPFLIISCLLRF